MLARFATVTCAAVLAIGGCKPQATARAEDAGPPTLTTAKSPAPEPLSPYDKVEKARTLKEALTIATPHFEDPPNDLGRGTILLIAWATKHMVWSDVGVSKDESSFALVMKDPEEERGKRLCASGQLIEIAVEKTEFGKVHVGLLMSDAGNLFRFYGVQSSGTLVQQNRARFCGVVTGKYDYSNSGGGTGHAAKLVGMFDLPENKTATK